MSKAKNELLRSYPDAMAGKLTAIKAAMTRRFAQAPPFRAGVKQSICAESTKSSCICCSCLVYYFWVRAEPSGANVVRFRARA